ncbi:MAG TPA: glycosyltransferase 87 family protein [Actinomycetota bacterium]|nr:glycosyltransferase 87 family protein [Actinomycetota bacterium]
MSNGARRIGLGTVFALLAGTLAIGYAIKAPCASGDWTDGRQYSRLCYSDNVHQLESEQLTSDRLPFLDTCRAQEGIECDEYPVLTMWTMRAAAWISGPSIAGYYVTSSIMMWIAAFVIAVLLYMLVGDRVLYFVLAPTLALYATMNWDLLAVAFATGGTFMYLRRRDGWSGVLLGLGAAAKVFPALLVVPFVAGRFRGKEPDGGIRLAWAAAGAWIAVNLPFVLAAPGAWWEFFRFNAGRFADWDSLWYLACQRATGQTCTQTDLVNGASVVMFIAWAGLVWAIKSRRDPGFARRTLGFPILVIFLLTNKVYSPQFSLWLLPWFAMAFPNLWLFVAFEAAEVAVFVTRFSWFGRYAGIQGGMSGIPLGVFEIAILVRAVILVLCVVRWVRTRPAAAHPAEASGAALAAEPLAESGAIA